MRAASTGGSPPYAPLMADEQDREREQRRLERDRRRREQGKPTYFDGAARPESWPVLDDPAERSTVILRTRRRRDELIELEARALDAETGGADVLAPPSGPAGADRGGGDDERRRLARSGLLFSLATGLSRVLGLVREIAARTLFGTTGPINAFEIAFLVPNTVRALVADAALSSAFVPVFSDLLEKGERKRAWRVASSLFWLMLLGLGGLTALFVLISPWVMEAFGYGPHAYAGIASGLSRVLFPIVVVLGLTGIVVGILNSYDHFTVPALSPVLWNLVIILGLVIGVTHVDSQSSKLYVYAAAIVVATVVQFLLPLPWLRGRDGRLHLVIDVHDPAVRRTFALMVPVTIGLGLININAFIDQIFATRLLDKNQAPAAIVAAFRLYMLPQGMFSVAVATVLFPSLSRFASRQDWRSFRSTVATGLRLISFLLVPASVAAAVLSTPIVRLLYQHGQFTPAQTPVVAHALAAFSLGLTFNGTMLMLQPRVLLASVAVDPELGRARQPRPECRTRRGLLPVRDLGDPALDLRRQHRGDVGAARPAPAADGQDRDGGDGAELRPRRARVRRPRRRLVVGLASRGRVARPLPRRADRLAGLRAPRRSGRFPRLLSGARGPGARDADAHAQPLRMRREPATAVT